MSLSQEFGGLEEITNAQASIRGLGRGGSGEEVIFGPMLQPARVPRTSCLVSQKSQNISPVFKYIVDVYLAIWKC